MAQPQAYRQSEENREDWQTLNPPYALSRAEQRIRFGQRRIQGIGSNGTTPSELAAKFMKANPGVKVGNFTPRKEWDEMFRRRPTISLDVDAPSDPAAFSALARDVAKVTFGVPSNSSFKPAESTYLGTQIGGAVDYMRRRKSPITDQLRKNNLGYDPLADPTQNQFGYA